MVHITNVHTTDEEIVDSELNADMEEDFDQVEIVLNSNLMMEISSRLYLYYCNLNYDIN